MLDTFTIVCCAIIIFAFLIAWTYISNTKDSVLPKKRRWIEQLPSIISTLGVLGTFAGITKGLIAFDTNDLDHSIPKLLDGMKTAFFTSLFGMIGSLVLNRVVSHKFDESKQLSDTEKAANQIVSAIDSLQREVKSNHNMLPTDLKNGNKDMVEKLSNDNTIKAIHDDLQQIKDDVEILKGKQEEMENTLEELKTACQTSAEESPRLRAIAMTATESISAIDNNIADIKEKVEGVEGTATDIYDHIIDSGD